jgi:hypothetical protein
VIAGDPFPVDTQRCRPRANRTERDVFTDHLIEARAVRWHSWMVGGRTLPPTILTRSVRASHVDRDYMNVNVVHTS